MPRSLDGWGVKLHERHVQTIIRFYYERGWSRQRLAERYSVTRSNIDQIVNSKIWKDVG